MSWRRQATGRRISATPGWGCMGSDGQWIDDAYHVEEGVARAIFRDNPEAKALCSNIDSDEITGEENQVIMEVKPAHCRECLAECPATFEYGQWLYPEEWPEEDLCPKHED